MQAYLVRRLIAGLVMVWGVVTIAFLLVRLLPGDVLLEKLGETGRLSDAQMEAARHQLGLDKPLYRDYLEWLGGALRGDLGDSIIFESQSVVGRIADSFPVTLELAIIASLVSLSIAIPIGILSAIRQDTIFDYVSRVFAITGLAVPGFWLAIMALIYLVLWFDYAPPFGYVPFWDNPTRNLELFYLPAFIMGYGLASNVMRMTRSSVLEVLRQDYVRTAWAKGLRERLLVLRHILPNALIPVITLFGNQFAVILSGAVIVEVIFGLPGIGTLTYNAVLQRDYTQIQGNVLFLGLIVVVVNLLVDVSYGFLDPRVRYR